jgi:hypothetical protein
MISQNPRPDIYDPKTLAVMDQAFAGIWHILRTMTPSAIMPTIASLELPSGTSLWTLWRMG